jgi:cytochrome c-type biogenesis protein CcmH
VRQLLALILLVLPLALPAVVPTYAFETPAQEARFQALTQQLRCLVCQGQSIADSNAELAADLRHEVHRLILEGKSDEEAIGFLTARYGDFVLFKPPVRASTWPLWFGPFVLLLVGGVALGVLIRRRHRQPPAQLSSAERERLDALLREERQ